jgi:predicted nucleotidyltransferase
MIFDSLFGNREQEQAERRKEFDRFLRSKPAFDLMRSQFISFLRSDEGKQSLVDILIEALPRHELAPILKSVETRLESLATEQVARLGRDAEKAHQTSVASHANALKRKSIEAAQNMTDRVKQDVGDYLSSYKANTLRALREHLLQEELASHVTPGLLLSSRRTNEQIAQEYQVSIREVKRWRRAARGLPQKRDRRNRSRPLFDIADEPLLPETADLLETSPRSSRSTFSAKRSRYLRRQNVEPQDE